jgi:hypothetical protein
VIVFDLRCTAGHVFEAWFGSSADYDRQRRRKLVACPLCGDSQIEKAVMAPAVAAKGNQQPTGTPYAAPGSDPAAAKAMLKALAELQKAAIESSEYVGDRFADEARAIHYGERDAGGIYGETSPGEAEALRAEGIAAMPLFFPLHNRRRDA